MNFVQKNWKGLLLCLIIALPAWWLGKLFPVIGGPVFAILFGMILAFAPKRENFASGITFTSKKILQYAIVLLGFDMNLFHIFAVGQQSLLIILSTISTSLIVAFLISKALKVPSKTAVLVGVGSSICGGSAIAATAPVIGAEDEDIAKSISTIFLFNVIAAFIFPALGHLMGMTDQGFGMWAGTAVNDTSSVVATGYAFSEAAGDFATMVKLTRTLAIIPTVLVFAAISVHLKKKAAAQSGDHGVKVNMKSVFPWFILGFLAMSILCSVGAIPAGLATTLKSISKFLMVAALAAIGLNTNFAALCKSGAKPMLHGFIISLLVVLVAIAVEYVLGIAPSGTLI